MSAQYNKSRATLIIVVALMMCAAAKGYDARPSDLRWVYPQELVPETGEIQYTWRFRLSPSYYRDCFYDVQLYLSRDQTFSGDDFALFGETDVFLPGGATGFTATVTRWFYTGISLPAAGTYYVFLKLRPGLFAPSDNNMSNNTAMAPNPIRVGGATPPPPPPPPIDEIIPVHDRKGHAFDPVNLILYITTQSGNVKRYDVTTENFLDDWFIGGTLGGIDVTPDGSTVLVADRSYDAATFVGNIHRVDASTGIVTTLEFPLYGGRPSFTETGSWDVVAMNNGKAFFTADFVGSAWVPLHELDLATNTIVNRPSSTFSGFNGVRERTWLFRNHDASVMLGLESDSSGGPAFSYTADTDSFIAGEDLGFYPGETPRSIFHSDGSGAVSHDGRWLAMEIESTDEVWILDTGLSYIAAKLSGIEGGVIFDPYEDVLYGLDSVNDDVVVFNTNAWSEIERIAVKENLQATQRFDEGVLSFDSLNSTMYVSVTGGILPIRIESEGSTASTEGDDFETGDFSKIPWEHAGDSDWIVTSQESHSGAYSAKAGTISDGDQSTLQVTLQCVQGNISFYRKVSSESGFDKLKFYIDAVEKGAWSGDQDWSEVSFPVDEGIRTFEWTYSKDGSVSEGEDTAWIDDIKLSGASNVGLDIPLRSSAQQQASENPIRIDMEYNFAN